ncbi:MAG: dioxygenase [Drouetiella hepatica Uher 2000/2452]|uniref:Dioxygenase n=1 Tax=Drouetiella hepatica Uher 2000/2452 TaxID=904376 RepID=A0A951QDU7_9CYAN|nr:dioxygenase [Drouetiella hepatica Uher 2000/2452]
MEQFPTLFISHGAPDLSTHEGEAHSFLKQLGQQFPKPKAILVVSAHWNTSHPTVSRALQPQTIHDFSGFPASLYQLTYPAPGAPDLADRVATLLNQHSLSGTVHSNRGLDHGAWAPLLLTYPEADIPVTQLSIQYDADPTHHLRVGKALEPLRREGVLILASGGATHNLQAFGASSDANPPTWVKRFDEWLAATIAQHDLASLLSYRQLAPYAKENHPTDEHLLPLFVALGAAGGTAKGTRLHNSYTYSVFSMAAYAFD